MAELDSISIEPFHSGIRVLPCKEALQETTDTSLSQADTSSSQKNTSLDSPFAAPEGMTPITEPSDQDS
jgi:hypothetical protein